MPVYERWKSDVFEDTTGKLATIRSHVPLSPKAKLALELWVDQRIWRKQEWSECGGSQGLAENCVQTYDLKGKDLNDFIRELKARKAGVDYKALRDVSKATTLTLGDSK